MKIKFFICLISLFTIHQYSYGNDRRIGKLNDVAWDNYFKLGSNTYPYTQGLNYPNLSCVGAVVSKDLYGTGTLIAPNIVVTAAHVLKNTLFDPTPNPLSWEFVLYNDYENAPSEVKYSIELLYLINFPLKEMSNKKTI